MAASSSSPAKVVCMFSLIISSSISSWENDSRCLAIDVC